MRVMVTEESYTSHASFLDLDVLPCYKPIRKTNRASLAAEMVAGIASKGVPPSMPTSTAATTSAEKYSRPPLAQG